MKKIMINESNKSVSVPTRVGAVGKRMKVFKKLSSKKSKAAAVPEKKESSKYLLRDHHREGNEKEEGGSGTPTGYFAVYVGEERRRFVVRTSFLSHPLFKMLLDKASEEFGFQQSNGLVVPCSVSAFQEVINSVECCNGKFEFGNSVDEFL